MFTVRQVERMWNAGQHQRILRVCMEMRDEWSARLLCRLSSSPVPAAAAALIRLDELGLSCAPLSAQLLRFILSGQQSDGGWGEPDISALCIRALACSHGAGLAIDCAIAHLADLQKTEGIWPSIPFRRMPADPFVSAFILHQLAGDARFRSATRFDDAVGWFRANQRTLDPESAHLWRLAQTRCVAEYLRDPILS